jgi:rubredoxin
MNGFEGSFLGDRSRIAPATVLECGVCWWVYDPTLGDETWQIPPGTAFTDLPDHWRCPGCDNPPQPARTVHGAQR